MYVPKNEPVNNGENILTEPVISFATILSVTDKSPSIEEDVLTLNPKFGDISAN